MRRIAVLMGGSSSEAANSRKVGRPCAAALRAGGFEVVEIEVGPDIVARLQEVRPDVAFNATMGVFGEDGTLQGALEALRIPYTHSGVKSSAIALDKALSRTVYADARLPIAPGRLLDRAELADGHPIAPPYVLKPNLEGSSLGLFVVGVDDDPPAPETEGLVDALLAEGYVDGRDLTVAVRGDEPMAVTEVRSGSGLWDVAVKDGKGEVEMLTPAPLPPAVETRCLDYALRAHRALGCRGLTRTDFRWNDALVGSDPHDGLVVLETNTQPGIGNPDWTLDSQLAYRGISLTEICRWLVDDASLDR